MDRKELKPDELLNRGGVGPSSSLDELWKKEGIDSSDAKRVDRQQQVRDAGRSKAPDDSTVGRVNKGQS